MDFSAVFGIGMVAFFIVYAIFGFFYKPGKRSKVLFSYRDIQASYRKPVRTDEDDFKDERKAVIHEWQEEDAKSSLQFCSRNFK